MHGKLGRHLRGVVQIQVKKAAGFPTGRLSGSARIFIIRISIFGHIGR